MDIEASDVLTERTARLEPFPKADVLLPSKNLSMAYVMSAIGSVHGESVNITVNVFRNPTRCTQSKM